MAHSHLESADWSVTSTGSFNMFASSTTMWTWSRTAALTQRLRLTGTCPSYLLFSSNRLSEIAQNPSLSIFPSVPCSIPCVSLECMLFTVSTFCFQSANAGFGFLTWGCVTGWNLLPLCELIIKSPEHQLTGVFNSPIWLVKESTNQNDDRRCCLMIPH